MQRKVSSRQAFGQFGAVRVMSSGPPNSRQSEAAVCQRAPRENESCLQDARVSSYQAVTPSHRRHGRDGKVLFLQEVFAATGDVETWSAGRGAHRDSVIMISSTTEREPFPAFLHIDVDSADESFEALFTQAS